jgi:hypothetical protein
MMLLVGVWKQELAEVRAFYTECGYRGGVSSEDTIVATTIGNRIIGVVRLCPEEGVLVLRGMEVRLEHQRRGIGSLMLRELDKLLGKRDAGASPVRIWRASTVRLDSTLSMKRTGLSISVYVCAVIAQAIRP